MTPSTRLNAQIDVLKSFSGPAFGLRQPTFLARFRSSIPAVVDWGILDRFAAKHLGAASKAGRAVEDAPLLGRIANWTAIVQEGGGLAVFERFRVLRRTIDDQGLDAILAVPYAPRHLPATLASLRWAAQAAALLMGSEPDACKEASDSLASLVRTLEGAAPWNPHALRCLEAAHDRGIPWDLVSEPVYQFGWGTRSRLMTGHFTDATPGLGIRLARDKGACAETLRRIGLPAPEHRMVTTLDDAEDAAAKLGYPVVVKPANLDRGIGVAADIRTVEHLRAAYAAARDRSNRILVEKHVAGLAYRLVVFDGQLLWAYVRKPASVEGDGIHSVTELIDLTNADPLRGDYPETPLQRLMLDEEALRMLEQANIGRDDVPAKGRVVRLSSVGNVCTGAVHLPVNNEVHPDNRRLAIDVADALRLDLAGIDLIMEDVSRSWHEIGAVVCEVNAGPQLINVTPPSLFGDIIGALCSGTGRIPTVVIIGAGRAAKIAELVAEAVAEDGTTIGVARDDEVRVGGTLVTRLVSDVFTGAQMLLSHRDVEVAFAAIEQDDVLETSLPFDRIDVLVIAGPLDGARANALARITRMLSPNSARIIFDGEADACVTAVDAIDGAKLQCVTGRDGPIAAAVVEAIERTRRLHASSSGVTQR